ncbi:MAG: pyruvate formate lyase family protein [Victivallales bacterium]
MKELRKQMEDYYKGKWPKNNADGTPDWSKFEVSHEIEKEMDEFVLKNPDTDPNLIKATLHETIAEKFEPVIFSHSPFYYEMGVKHAFSWGTPHQFNVGSWMFRKYHHLFEKSNPEKVKMLGVRAQHGIDVLYGYVDTDHHSVGYTKVLEKGISGVIDEALDCRSKCRNDSERNFIDAALGSMNAMIKVSKKFSEKAKQMLEEAGTDEERKFLSMIAAAAAHVPEHPPRSFYEGLAALWFLRDVTGSMEGIGISILGHPDRVLYKLYRDDIENGRLTREEAVKLAGIWMIPTDIKFDIENSRWPETSTTLTLGGCDREGNPIFNEVTEIFLEAHLKNGFINPKLNCRFGAKSDKRYIRQISEQILGGHNVFALLNDDCLVRSNVKAGKKVEDCNLYGAGGCQETVIEGCEHSEGAYYYFNMPRILDYCIHRHDELESVFSELRMKPVEILKSRTFEECYEKFLRTTAEFIVQGAEFRRDAGKVWPSVNPCPFFSSTLYGCLENRKDYSAGGAKYNPSGLSLVGFGTVVDSLHAIKQACFDEKWIGPDALESILHENWEGHESMRSRFAGLPKFGHNCPEVDDLARRFADDLARISGELENSRGGEFQPSFFVYYSFVGMAKKTLATPDGRCNGDMYAQGVSPGRISPASSLTDTIMSLEKVDFSNFPGNAVLDVQLPMGKMSVDTLSSVIMAFGRINAPTLQCNCVDVGQLRDAQIHPGQHRDLMVRISGLSAKFIALEKDVQDEIIRRNMFQ